MKCDELCVYKDCEDFQTFDRHFTEAYKKSEVDDAIAELNQTIDKLVGIKKSAEQILQDLLDCGLIKEWYFNGMFNAVLKADDPHLQIAELNERDRKTQRALWLARAAMCRTYDIRTYFIDNPESKRRFIDFFVLMQKAAATAAIKAEEYK